MIEPAFVLCALPMFCPQCRWLVDALLQELGFKKNEGLGVWHSWSLRCHPPSLPQLALAWLVLALWVFVSAPTIPIFGWLLFSWIGCRQVLVLISILPRWEQTNIPGLNHRLSCVSRGRWGASHNLACQGTGQVFWVHTLCGCMMLDELIVDLVVSISIVVEVCY